MIMKSANRSRAAYSTTADAVAKMGIMAGDAFSSNEELIAFSELINKQFTIAGTSAAGIDAAMLQLTQAMSSGVLRGEELNSVFEQAPTIIRTIADHHQSSQIGKNPGNGRRRPWITSGDPCGMPCWRPPTRNQREVRGYAYDLFPRCGQSRRISPWKRSRPSLWP
ncbi:MAG: tape measure protein [Flavonifractor plautii]